MIIYKQPRQGVFSIHQGEWDKKNNCWKEIEEVNTIIGEIDCGYITRILETSIHYRDEHGRYEAFMCSAVWIHKSRFIKWETTQLELFK